MGKRSAGGTAVEAREWEKRLLTVRTMAKITTLLFVRRKNCEYRAVNRHFYRLQAVR